MGVDVVLDLEPAVIGAKRVPPWLARVPAFSGWVPGGRGPILVGDPRDAQPLGPLELRWGLPNPWLEAKGGDPWDGARAFVSAGTAGNRGLLPVTHMGGHRLGEGVVTLAAIWACPESEPGAYGFAVLGTADDPQVVPEGFREAWMDGWVSMEGGVRGLVGLVGPLPRSA